VSPRQRLLLRLRSRGRAEAAAGTQVGRGVVWDIAEGGRVVLEQGAVVGDRCRFHVGPEARVVLGAGARLAERCVIAAHERVEVRAGAVLGPEVVLLDVDQDVGDVETPVRLQPLVTAPVVIGEHAVLDAAAVVLHGVRIGSGARVGARSVVRADVADEASVLGVPARRPGRRGPTGPALQRRREQ
jgi:acetyltransferase-like isoleucine patch superfamily enzyme